MIELIRVSKTYPRGRGIEDISLRVNKGEWYLICGHVGAGKSTLLRLIFLDEFPDSGEVIVGQFRSSSIKSRHITKVRRMLGIVHQDLHLLDDRTVFQNVSLVGDVLGWSTKKTKESTLKVLNRVGLYAHLDMFPDKLSSGERHRLAIARALVSEPFALIADEPLGHLDEETAHGIVELFREINARGTALIMATHRMGLFSHQPVNELHIRQGRLVEQ